MKQVMLTVTENVPVNANTVRMSLTGDISAFTAPGQFLNIRLPGGTEGFYLRRPISLDDLRPGSKPGEGEAVILYRIAGSGTEAMRAMPAGTVLDVLTGLGNGFDTARAGEHPLLIGGGIGSAPLYYLARVLRAQGKAVSAVLGFNSAQEILLAQELRELGVNVTVTTADGSAGLKGFVTDALAGLDYSYYYACGPERMLRAVFKAAAGSGELSFEARMGCGFGACMGCTCRTIAGFKRICKDGPIMRKEELLWED